MDPSLIILIALIAVMAIFMFRNSKKRQQEMQTLQERLVPGAEVMTSHGIFGTLITLDTDKNEAIIETMPGTMLRLHSQTISRVVDPEESADRPEDESSDGTGEPGTPRTTLD